MCMIFCLEMSDAGKAEVFNTYFNSVLTQEDNASDMPDFCASLKESLGNNEFTEFDVLKLLQDLNSSKSPGLDNMHPIILKECAQELAVPLYTVSQKTSHLWFAITLTHMSGFRYFLAEILQ